MHRYHASFSAIASAGVASLRVESIMGGGGRGGGGGGGGTTERRIREAVFYSQGPAIKEALVRLENIG